MSPAAGRKRKLSNPPVKVACLACRAARIRCDGKSVCTNCETKNRTCSYTKSNRGGPRVARKKAAIATEEWQEPKVVLGDEEVEPFESDPSQFSYDEAFWDLVVPMISPGAGLKDVDSDQIFDSIFGTGASDLHLDHGLKRSIEVPTVSPSSPPLTRNYGSNKDILNAYYVFIHPYFPILPPPEWQLEIDSPLAEEADDFEPSSPISLALSAILALIPHPNDLDPRNQSSLTLRRRQAQLFAQLAMESIEIEAEVLSSATSPSEALSSDPSEFRRQPFHTNVPTELESVLAYLVLSIYEYAQRGNIAKMRNRASQAYDAAIRLGLQEDSDEDIYAEARRRAWWMTYVCVLQGSIVSSLAPIIPVDYRQFHAPLPRNESDSEAWPAFLDAQQLILKCTQFTVALKKTINSRSDLSSIQDKMVMLENEVDSLIARYTWSLDPPVTTPVDYDEQVLAKSLKAQAQIKLNSARIKLHRYRAFLDAPIFTQRHCDLEKAGDPVARKGSSSGCSCSTLLRQSPPGLDISKDSSSSSSASSSPPSVISDDGSPFSSLISAKACMKAALNISRAFESLPYPNPTQADGCLAQTFLSDTSLTYAPRTMPGFACCAMQSSYALLMLCQKSRDYNRHSMTGPGFHNGLEELYSGLQRVLSALENYSIAFEALDGMRVQIQEAFDSFRHAQKKHSFSVPLTGWS